MEDRPKLNHIHEHQSSYPAPKIVAHEEWVKQRKELLQKEKQLQRHIDEVVKARRELGWEKIGDYKFEGPNGVVHLSELFGTHKDLMIQHLMFAEKDEKACPSCTQWLDNYNGSLPHIRQRAAFFGVAKASVAKLEAMRKLKGYDFQLLSSAGCTFNVDFGVEQPPHELDAQWYNYGSGCSEKCYQYPGLSVFRKGEDGSIYHTYSTYARGLDRLNAAHALFDLLPYGRDGFHPRHREDYAPEQK